ncbi:hypothetical protein ACERZ8_14400 [Tateyamaria armeniaca]|uniref:Uncharacterized protein n=1 Tax=Tateyamaria armeniaca TaxID=2518930 RepID=A0ABW8UW98_9RHOB
MRILWPQDWHLKILIAIFGRFRHLNSITAFRQLRGVETGKRGAFKTALYRCENNRKFFLKDG